MKACWYRAVRSWAAGGRAGAARVRVNEDKRPGEDEPQHEELPALPRHLSALIGSLRGPADLGRNHDKYLTYADREEAGGAASALGVTKKKSQDD